MLTMLAQAGHKCITTTLIEETWNHQTYDDFGSMIKWTKRTDGTWTYDYSHFDTYVALAMECGITRQIHCYSMVPVGNRISWFDENSAKAVTAELLPGASNAFTRKARSASGDKHGYRPQTRAPHHARTENKGLNMRKGIAMNTATDALAPERAA